MMMGRMTAATRTAFTNKTPTPSTSPEASPQSTPQASPQAAVRTRDIHSNECSRLEDEGTNRCSDSRDVRWPLFRFL